MYEIIICKNDGAQRNTSNLQVDDLAGSSKRSNEANLIIVHDNNKAEILKSRFELSTPRYQEFDYVDIPDVVREYYTITGDKIIWNH